MAFIEIRTPQKFTNPEGLIEIPQLGRDVVASWDANTLTMGDGAEVTSWPAGGSLGLVADQTVGSNSFPTLEVGAVNGHNAVSFSASNAIRALGSLVPSSSGKTVAFVYRADTIPNGVGNYVFDTNNSGTSGQAAFMRAADHIWQHKMADTTVRVYSEVAPQVGQWVGFVGRFEGNTARMIGTAMSGETVVSGITATALSDISIGAEYRGYSGLDGAIASITIYDRAISDTEATTLLDVLARKYGL